MTAKEFGRIAPESRNVRLWGAIGSAVLAETA
jgi:hypothetical protein